MDGNDNHVLNNFTAFRDRQHTALVSNFKNVLYMEKRGKWMPIACSGLNAYQLNVGEGSQYVTGSL